MLESKNSTQSEFLSLELLLSMSASAHAFLFPISEVLSTPSMPYNQVFAIDDKTLPSISAALPVLAGSGENASAAQHLSDFSFH